MSRFVAYIAGDAPTTVADAILTDLEALIVRTYAGVGLRAGVTLEPIEVASGEPAIETESGQPINDADVDAMAAAARVEEPVATLPLYTVDGDVNTVSDPNAYPLTDVHTPEGRPLFHFTGDQPGGPATADGAGGIWHVYDGETVVNAAPIV